MRLLCGFLKTVGMRVLCHHNTEREVLQKFVPFGPEGVSCLVSQLIRVNVLIDCLLFKPILEVFWKLSEVCVQKKLWNFLHFSVVFYDRVNNIYIKEKCNKNSIEQLLSLFIYFNKPPCFVCILHIFSYSRSQKSLSSKLPSTAASEGGGRQRARYSQLPNKKTIIIFTIVTMIIIGYGLITEKEMLGSGSEGAYLKIMKVHYPSK